MHSWSTFGARTSHGQMDSQDSPWPGFGGSYHLPPLIVYFVPSHETNTQMSFLSRDSQIGVLKFPKLGFLRLWRPITLCADLRLGWGQKQSCSPHWELSNSMWHYTFMPPARKGIKAIPDFEWSGVKLAIWLPTFILAITYVLTKWVMQALLKHLCSKKFPMI